MLEDDQPPQIQAPTRPAPFQTKQFARNISGVPTEFILTSYENYLFFTITQFQKLGTIVSILINSLLHIFLI